MRIYHLMNSYRNDVDNCRTNLEQLFTCAYEYCVKFQEQCSDFKVMGFYKGMGGTTIKMVYCARSAMNIYFMVNHELP